MREFAHDFPLPLPPDQALPYFTPRGEEAWVPGWSPRYVWPESGATCTGMVFETGTGEARTIWSCLTFDRDRHHARYLRVTPALHSVLVDVRCHPAPGGTGVRVAYRYHPLTRAGADLVAAMTDDGFATEIDGWRALVMAHHARTAAPPDC